MKLACSAILRELLPEQVGVPRKRRRAAVAQMRRQRRAPPHGLDDRLRARGRVTDRDANARRDETIDEVQRARHFGRERHETNHSVCRVLSPREIVRRGGRHRGRIVGAARAVVARNVGALHVQAKDSRGAAREHALRTSGEPGEIRRDQRRQERRHARDLHGGGGSRHVLGGRRRVVEIDAGKAVDLQVAEARDNQGSRFHAPAGIPQPAGSHLQSAAW